jgi:hypothetical protein
MGGPAFIFALSRLSRGNFSPSNNRGIDNATRLIARGTAGSADYQHSPDQPEDARPAA